MNTCNNNLEDINISLSIKIRRNKYRIKINSAISTNMSNPGPAKLVGANYWKHTALNNPMNKKQRGVEVCRLFFSLAAVLSLLML